MKIIPSLISFITFLLLLSCSEGKKYNAEIKGNTMGTYYIINIVDIPPRLNLEFIKKEIKKTLLQANSILSNWDEKSEISLLNNNQRIGAFKISNELKEVLKNANIINLKSEGYFDITLDPLIELWGFGYKKEKLEKIPADHEINKTLLLINQKKFVNIDEDKNEIYKKNKFLKLNLSAIGKGYGIDLIGRKLDALGLNNYLINIGGDLLTKGYNKKKQDWIIGVENPKLEEKMIKEIVNVTNKGIASSGDYKNFFMSNGKRYSHIINPKTGKPISHRTKSVTVISHNATYADGWATALLAMGREKGLILAEKEKLAVLFIDEIDKKLIKFKSSEFKKLN